MKRIKKKLSKILLSLTMVFAMALSIMPINTYASTLSNITVGGADATADYGEPTVANLQKAVNDISGGGIIKIGANIDFGTTSVTVNKDLTLDLNCHAITYNGNITGTGGITVIGGANFTITGVEGSTLTSTAGGTNAYAIFNSGTGTVNINGGTIASTGNNARAIGNNSTGTITISGGAVSSSNNSTIYTGSTGIINVTGGKVMNSSDMMYAIANQGSGTVNISGGTVFATGANAHAIANGGIVNVSGGTVSATKANNAISNFGGTQINITGGSVTGVTVSSGTMNAVEKYTFTLKNSGSSTANSVAVESLALTPEYAYGMTDVMTDANGNIYIWLPSSAQTTAATATVSSSAGSASGTYESGSTAITGKTADLVKIKSDTDLLNEAKPLAESAITAISATNNTTARNILDAVTAGISSVDGVTASWKSAPTITPATKENTGSITGTIVLSCGSETVEVEVNKTIAQLPITDKDKVDEAKPLAQSAITAIIATNSTTAGNILDAVTTAISPVDGVTASWKSAPTITPATQESAGSITGIIVLTCGSETVEVTVNKLIEKLPAPTPDRPTITVGNSGSNHQINNGKDMTFTCSGKLEDLTGVYVDGKLVDESNYALLSGSTILTLKASYLDTLSAGKHTLKFQYKDNVSAETDFTIIAKSGVTPPKPSSPQTGDTSNTMLYFGLIILSGCIAGFGFKKKKSLIK